MDSFNNYLLRVQYATHHYDTFIMCQTSQYAPYVLLKTPLKIRPLKTPQGK